MIEMIVSVLEQREGPPVGEFGMSWREVMPFLLRGFAISASLVLGYAIMAAMVFNALRP
jgi:hypothetical protein